MRVKMTLWGLLVLLLLGPPCFGAAPAATRSTTAPADEVALGQKLSWEIVEANILGQGLGDVLDFVRDLGGVNLVVNWRELSGQHVDEHTVITFSGRNLTVADLLRAVLAAASPRISYEAKAGAVYVTSRRDLFARAGDVRVPGDASDASAAVNEALEKAQSDVELKSIRLREAFGLIGASLRVPVDVDWPSLQAAGVDAEEPITLSLKQPTGSEVLHWIIRPLEQRRAVVFSVRDGKVVVMAAPQAKGKGQP